MISIQKLLIALACGASAVGLGAETPVPSEGREPPLIADARAAEAGARESASAPAAGTTPMELLISAAARDLASAALAVEAPKAVPQGRPTLPVEGRPGDVRLVVTTTDLAARKRWVVPKLPIPPFIQWSRWMEEHKESTHCSLDWMDEQGRWWHTELRGYNQHPEQYRVGEGEFPGTGLSVYGIFILPGQTGLEDHDLVSDERIEMDYRAIELIAREYGRKDKRPGDPGTGGNGSSNAGLGGPAFKPTQNSNTYISYLLRRAGAKHAMPDRAVGWDTKPRFPYSSDAQE